MRTECALYRVEKHNDDGIMWLKEYCDGLFDPYCKKNRPCPFYKSRQKYKAIVVRKLTQYVRVDE